MIAEAVQQRAAEAAGEAEEGSMITLAVEGNISAGKSTFLDVLSHEDANLQELLQVGRRLCACLHVCGCVCRLLCCCRLLCAAAGVCHV
jgi:hypothetical protein